MSMTISNTFDEHQAVVLRPLHNPPQVPDSTLLIFAINEILLIV